MLLPEQKQLFAELALAVPQSLVMQENPFLEVAAKLFLRNLTLHYKSFPSFYFRSTTMMRKSFAFESK